MAKNKEMLAKVAHWHDLTIRLRALKAEEMELRKEIFTRLFEGVELCEGTNKLDLPDGWILKADHKYNYSLDAAALPAVLTVLGAAGHHLVRYKPELVLPEYRKMSDEQKAVLGQALNIKPASPSLTLVAPKK